MDRRDALRMLAATTVAPRFFDWDAADLIDGLRGHLAHHRRARPPRAGPYAFQLLTPAQQALVDELAELIIPATDTPGARQTRVVEFVDVILAEWATDNDRTLFLNGLADVEARARARSGSAFVEAPVADRVAILLHGKLVCHERLDELKQSCREVNALLGPGQSTPPDIPGEVLAHLPMGHEHVWLVRHLDEPEWRTRCQTANTTTEIRHPDLEDLLLLLLREYRKRESKPEVRSRDEQLTGPSRS